MQEPPAPRLTAPQLPGDCRAFLKCRQGRHTVGRWRPSSGGFKKRIPQFVASVALSLATASAAAYTFTELTFQASSAATVFNNEAERINNEGQVVGNSGSFGAFYSGEQGFVLNLATGNADTLSALLPSTINDAGQIIGSVLVGSGIYTTTGPTFLLDTTTGAFATYPSYSNYPYNFIANNNIGQIDRRLNLRSAVTKEWV